MVHEGGILQRFAASSSRGMGSVADLGDIGRRYSAVPTYGRVFQDPRTKFVRELPDADEGNVALTDNG